MICEMSLLLRYFMFIGQGVYQGEIVGLEKVLSLTF